MLTRLVDIIVSLVGCLLLLPMLPVIAVLIKIDSRGPVFYSCNRVGRGGKIFRMYKFRTMQTTSVALGPSVSPLGDPRVTAMGSILRRLKLNEFPQFINVLKGDMTLIGPRPEAPDLAAYYPPEACRIFTVKPGLAGPSQILGRNEEELYPPGVDPQQYYLTRILPGKLRIDLQYIDDKSLWRDFKYLLLAVKVTLTAAVARRHLADNLGQILLMVCDLVCCLLSFTLAHLLRFDSFADPSLNKVLLRFLPWIILARLPVFIYFNFYHSLLSHLSLYDVKRIFHGVAISSLVLVGLSFFLGHAIGYSRAVFFIDWFCLTILLIGYRALFKMLYQRIYSETKANGDKKRVLIWGAGDWGELCLRYLRKKVNPAYEVVGFIDDDRKKRNRRLNGVKVLGDRNHLEIICQLYKVHEIFISIQQASPVDLQRLIEVCTGMGLPTRIFSDPGEPVAETFFKPKQLQTSRFSMG
jgi:lipopolysaccharide/colanic/teichoic acid biosynthesis glycosyltransferase